MDQEGFLPIGLIASFHRVQALTTNIALIVEVSTFSCYCGEKSTFSIILLWLTGSENLYIVTCMSNLIK